MEIKRVAIYGRKHPEQFRAWLSKNGIQLVCYIDDAVFDSKSEGVPVLSLPEFISKYENNVDAILVNHSWNISNSNSYFKKLGQLKKPVLWSSLSIRNIDERVFEYSKKLFSMHLPRGLNELYHFKKLAEKFQVGWRDFSELLVARYDEIEPNTLSILQQTYELCENIRHASVDSMNLALEYARIYSNILSKNRDLPYGDEYCYGKIHPQNGHRIISAGGDVGHEISEFIEKIGKDGGIIIFEASRSSFAFLKKKFNGDARIEVSNKALHSSSSTLEFFESVDDPGASTVVAGRQYGECERYTVESISLDEYIEQSSLPSVDYIKMDIEGAEYGALIGAESTIKTFRPMLSICVYHPNPIAGSILEEDIFRIPELIRRYAPGYKLHLVNTELTPWSGVKMFGVHHQGI